MSSPDDSPPGLGRIRRFFDRRWIRGAWLWLRFVGRGIRAGWGWTNRNAGPILRGLARAAEAGAELSRRASRAGRIAKGGGRRLTAWAARRRREGSRWRFDDSLRESGEELDEWGGKVDREAADASQVLDSVSDFAEALIGSDPRPASGALPPPARAELSPPRAEPALPPPALDQRSGPAPDRAPELTDAPDHRFDELLARVAKLGKRRRREPLRALIVEMLEVKGWATTGELADWLDMNAKHLRKTHLRPMLKAGRLRLRHPDSPSHPDQAYGLPVATPTPPVDP